MSSKPSLTIFASELAAIMGLKPKSWGSAEDVEARLLTKHCPEAGVKPVDRVEEAREAAVDKLATCVEADKLADLLVDVGQEREASRVRAKTMTKSAGAAALVDAHTAKATAAADACASVAETKAAMPSVAAAYVAEATRSKAYTDRGTRGEASVLERWCKEQGVTASKPSRFFVNRVSPGLRLGGYVDGVTADKTKVIEIKKRQRGFFPTLRGYEKAQIHAYLFSVGVRSCLLVEEYKGGFKTTAVEWDPSFWVEACDALNTFRDRVYATIARHRETASGAV